MLIIDRLGRRLVALEWLLLILMLPLVLFPTPANSLALLLIPLIWVMRRVTTGVFIPATPLDWPLFGLLFMILVSLYTTTDISFSFPKVAGILFGVAVYYATIYAVDNSPRRLWLAVGLLMAAAWGMASLSIFSAEWSGKFPLLAEITARMPAGMLTFPGLEQLVSPNEVAGVLLWVVPLNVTIVCGFLGRFRRRAKVELSGRSSLYSAFLLISMFFLTGLLILTQSRAGWLGFAVALLFVLMVFIWQRRRWLIAVSSLLILFVVVVLGVVGPEATLASLLNSVSAGTGITAVDTLEGRMEIWSRALYGIHDFPLTGMGLNMFRRLVHVLYPLFLISPDIDIAHAHNQLLQTALGLGLPGLIAYLAILLGVGGMLWQSWYRTDDVWLRTLALGLSASLLAHFTFGFMDTVALGARPGFMFWLLLGVAASLHRLIVSQVEVWRRPRG